MAWTYANNPVVGGNAAQQRDAVRFYAQENDTAKQRVTDEEIAMLLANEQNVWMAAACVAEAVANRMGPVSSKSVDGLSISYSRADYLALAGRLRARGANYQTPSVGGISSAAKDAQEADTDWVQPTFARGVHDNPGSLTSSRLRDAD